MQPELLTAAELARQLRVQVDTVRRWAREGRIPCLRISPKVVRYERARVVDAIRAELGAPGEATRG